MKTNVLSKIKTSLYEVVRHYPIELLLGVTFFVIYYRCVADNKESVFNVLLLFPVFFVLTYTLHRLADGKYRWIYWLSYLFFVPFFFVDLQPFYPWGYGFTGIAAFFLLLVVYGRSTDKLFACDAANMVLRMVRAVASGAFLYIMLALIMVSLEYIFGINFSDSYIHLFLGILLIFIPLVFCALRQSISDESPTMGKFGSFMLNYILSPALVIYTIVLYVYIVTIVVNWELPKGGLAYMVLAFVIVAMVGQVMQHLLSRNIFKWYYNWFGLIGIPVIILFWVGVGHRIAEYGFTEARVYLCVAGFVMTYYIISLSIKRLSSYRLMFTVAIVIILVFTFIPGISARSIGIWSQANRLEHYAVALGVWDGARGKLKENLPVTTGDAAKELKASYLYLCNVLGREEVARRWTGEVDVYAVFCDDTDYPMEEVGTPSFRVYRDFSQPVNVSGYKNFYQVKSNFIDGKAYHDVMKQNVYELYDDSNILLYTFDMEKHLAPHLKHLEQAYSNNESSKDISLFVVGNDSLKIVFDYIEIYTAECDTIYTMSNAGVFVK